MEKRVNFVLINNVEILYHNISIHNTNHMSKEKKISHLCDTCILIMHASEGKIFLMHTFLIKKNNIMHIIHYYYFTIHTYLASKIQFIQFNYKQFPTFLHESQDVFLKLRPYTERL